MKIAVTYGNDGTVFQHFGKCETFAFYEIEDGAVVSHEVLSTNGVGHHELAGWLKQHGVETVICGGLGAGMVNALKAQNIRIAAGVVGKVEEAVQAFLDGTISLSEVGNCDCHGEGHHHDHDGMTEIKFVS